jgi:CRP/FNR family transcriptional regulator, cyclic AMP receptor protein
MPAKETSSFKPQAFLASIGPGRRVIEFRKKDAIFAQGQAANAVFYIHSGKVKLTVVSQQGKEATIGMLGPGDFFGEGSIAGQPLRMSSASAITECSVSRIEKKKDDAGIAPATHLF